MTRKLTCNRCGAIRETDDESIFKKGLTIFECPWCKGQMEEGVKMEKLQFKTKEGENV